MYMYLQLGTYLANTAVNFLGSGDNDMHNTPSLSTNWHKSHFWNYLYHVIAYILKLEKLSTFT